MATRVIDAILRMKDDGFTKTFKDSINLMTKYGREGNKVRKSIANAGKSMVSMGQAMTAAVTVPMVAMATASAKKFGEVDKTLRLVAATMGEAKWATADLTGAMKEAAANSVFSMQESADAVLNFARQGFNAKQAADMLSGPVSITAAVFSCGARAIRYRPESWRKSAMLPFRLPRCLHSRGRFPRRQ